VFDRRDRFAAAIGYGLQRLDFLEERIESPERPVLSVAKSPPDSEGELIFIRLAKKSWSRRSTGIPDQ
jgi:hypothetical protein